MPVVTQFEALVDAYVDKRVMQGTLSTSSAKSVRSRLRSFAPFASSWAPVGRYDAQIDQLVALLTETEPEPADHVLGSVASWLDDLNERGLSEQTLRGLHGDPRPVLSVGRRAGFRVGDG